MRKYLLLFLAAMTAISCTKKPEERIQQIFDYFTNDNETAVATLEAVSTNFPARMSSSENNDGAVDYFTLILGKQVKVDNLYTQDVTVPHWLPGEYKVSYTLKDGSKFDLTSVPVGLSVGTDGNDLTAEVVEVASKNDFEKAVVKGKIVFFNEAMQEGKGYGSERWQRTHGATLAAQKGAVGVLVRSLTDKINDDPHTGSLHYDSLTVQIPAMAISTQAAENLSAAIKKDKKIQVTINSTCKRLEDGVGRNLIAEIKGKKNPNHVILLSAHIDSWFNSQGAQDNAASCVAAVEVLRAYKKLHIRPNNTIRILLYQDEECFLSGMKEFAKIAHDNNEEYLFDLEMDSGAGGPKTFMVGEPEDYFNKMKEITNQYLSPYGIEEIIKMEVRREGWPLNVPYYGYLSNTEHYFDVHHSSSDNFDKVDQDAFKKGIAAITAFVYLMN